MDYKYLDKIDDVKYLKSLSMDELEILCKETRHYIIEAISKTGGHLAPSLGVVELTIALLYVYDSPEDSVLWDVGHQAYPWKVLTGRREELKNIRQYGGISGFQKRSESVHDAFGAGHASTSISAGLGFSVANELLQKNDPGKVISVIGDGALTGGLAYEGLNNAGSLRKQLMVILNDNNMSISPNVGAISKYLHKIVTNPIYNRLRDEIWNLTSKLPGKLFLRKTIRKIEESLKVLLVPGILFDELGFRYFGPVDGHNLPSLIDTLKKIKDIKTPVLLHILTTKGKGLPEAEQNPTQFHGIKGKVVENPNDNTASAPSYTQVFGETLTEIAEKHENVAGITAAMSD
ncbi:MAG: 1-deoxy-D-xylulose-5-phosphate synthase, partial [Candidatus Marinimicrobia bacterium]|nr:1-deoxy-D-xylulose-5-phosphate synthase [Candidatus Neomarinimicrobiota bacterium]